MVPHEVTRWEKNVTKQRKTTSKGSCTNLTTQLGIAVVHGAELPERMRGSLLEVPAKGVAHLLHWTVGNHSLWVTAQRNYKGLMSILGWAEFQEICCSGWSWSEGLQPGS